MSMLAKQARHLEKEDEFPRDPRCRSPSTAPFFQFLPLAEDALSELFFT